MGEIDGKIKVLGITGIRSEYYLQKPIFNAIKDHPKLELDLVVTGAHLSPLHGYTVRAIEDDGFEINTKIENLLYSDRDSGRLKSAALQLQTLSHIIDDKRPQWILAPADREEAITVALCGAYLNIATAQYSAGDRDVGNVDDTVRHAVSRLSHLLLTTHDDAKQRLIRSGEQDWRVHDVGHAGLDRIAAAPCLSDDDLSRDLDVPEIKSPYLVVIQHPISNAITQARRDMEETLEAVLQLDLQCFVSYPNSDAGSQAIISVIEQYAKYDNIHAFKNIPDVPFVNLLKGASALIGNSSMGLLEAPFLKLPVVNVGQRQSERHHAENVFFVSHEKSEICRQVELILHDRDTQKKVASCSNPFGDGKTGQRVANLLAETPVDDRLLNKDLTI